MPDAEEADRSDEEQERLNRQMTELLNELCVAALFGWLWFGIGLWRRWQR